jgi:hypothetical protein
MGEEHSAVELLRNPAAPPTPRSDDLKITFTKTAGHLRSHHGLVVWRGRGEDGPPGQNTGAAGKQYEKAADNGAQHSVFTDTSGNPHDNPAKPKGIDSQPKSRK